MKAEGYYWIQYDYLTERRWEPAEVVADGYYEDVKSVYFMAAGLPVREDDPEIVKWGPKIIPPVS